MDGRTAQIDVTLPGHLKLTAVVVALSEPEAKLLEKMAEQLNSPNNVEFKTFFRDGSLHLSLEMLSDDHLAHIDEQAAVAAANHPIEDVLTAEDEAELRALSGSGGIAVGTAGMVPPLPSGADLDAVVADPSLAPNVAIDPPAPPAVEPADPQDPTGLVDPT